jgi:serine/threonine protein kinase
MDEKAALRFHREIRIMEDLAHPCVVRLFDQGNDRGRPWYACEFCPEGSLHELFAERYRGPLPVDEACRLICLALEGLAYAHEKGYVHRDLKPSNILLAKRDGTLVAKVADFGLAKSLDGAGLPSITRTGEAAGSLLFMPPEQFLNFKRVEPAADVYALGVTLYLLLTGKFPFDFPSPLEQILKGKRVRDPVEIVLQDEPIPVEKRRPDLLPGLADVVNRAIRKNAGARFPSAVEFRAALERARKGGRL